MARKNCRLRYCPKFHYNSSSSDFSKFNGVAKIFFFLGTIKTERNARHPLDTTKIPEMAFMLCERDDQVMKHQNNVLSECSQKEMHWLKLLGVWGVGLWIQINP